jgi:conjugal transfer ATP-binding protein TraC
LSDHVTASADSVEERDRKHFEDSPLFSRWKRVLSRDRVADLLPWLAFDPRTRLVFCDGGYLGAVYEARALSGIDGATIAEVVAALQQEMPAGTVMQVLNFNVPDIGNDLRAFVRARNGIDIDDEIPEAKRQALLRAASSTIKHMQGMFDTGAFSDSHVALTTTRVFITLKFVASDIPTQAMIDRILDRLAAIEGAARMLGMRRLEATEFLAVVRRMLHIHEPASNIWGGLTLLKNEVTYPGDAFDIVPGGLRVSYSGNEGRRESHVRVLATKFFPKNMALDMMNLVIGDPMGVRTQFTFPYMLVWTAVFPDQVDARRTIERDRAVINYQAFGPLARWVPRLYLRKEGYDILTNALENGDRVVECSLSVVMWCRDEQAASQEAALVQASLASTGFECKLDRYLGAVQFFNSLPLVASEESLASTERTLTVSTSQAAQTLPILGDWRGQVAGPHLNPVCEPGAGTPLVTRRGHVAWADPFATTGNFNFIVAGDSGSGKTFYAQQLLLDHLESGGQAWVIEIGRGFEKMCDLVGGHHIRLSDNSTFGLNPFSSVKDLDDEIDELAGILGAMIDPATELTHRSGLDASDTALLKEAIRAVWGARAREATPDDVAQYLYQQPGDTNIGRRAQMLARMMGEFTRNGAYGHWFNKPMDVDLTGRFVVLELGDLAGRHQLMIVVLLQMMFAIQRHIQDQATLDNRRRILFVDEASELLKIKAAAEFMEGTSRRARKSRGAIGIGIQRVDDLYYNEYTKIIASQAESYYLLKQRQETINSLQKDSRLALDDWGYTQLRSLRRTNEYSEVMIYQGGSYVVARLTVDRFRRTLFSSSGAERDFILSKMDQGMHAAEAIDLYITEHPED